MSSRSTRAQHKLAAQAVGLSLAVPQVVAHRVARMASASPLQLSARDRREFSLMGAEKAAAFAESWAAMVQAAFSAQLAMWHTLWRNAALLPLGLAQPAALWPTPAALAAHAVRVTSQGLAPVHRRATDNARRLGRVKTRR